MSVSQECKKVLCRAWRIDAPLTTTLLLMLSALGLGMIALRLDPRMVMGAPVWLKPVKFALSIGVYCGTLLAVFASIPTFVRTRRVVGWATAVAMWLELGIIILQAARGRASHFNVGTPLDAALFGVMGAAIGLQTLSTVAVAAALFRQRFFDDALGWALRYAMVITIAGASLGALMTRPTEAQLADMRAGQPSGAGAHTVGAQDGGAGFPGVGWSRAHGDLRAPHFLALHALQVLPVGALALRRTRLPSARRTRLVWVWSASYAALVALTLWQAMRAEPLLPLSPSVTTAFTAWAVLTGLLSLSIVTWVGIAGYGEVALNRKMES